MSSDPAEPPKEDEKDVPANNEDDDDDDDEDLFGGGDDDNEAETAPVSAEPPTPSAVDAQVEKQPSTPKAEVATETPAVATEATGDSVVQPTEAAQPAPAPAPTTDPLGAIPRVSAPASSPPLGVSPSKTNNSTDGSRYGLPAGVVIPATVSPTLLQGRLLDTVRTLPAQLITDALAEYDDAVQVKGQSIRNHGAYLFGVIKRYVNVQERAASGEGTGILPMGPELTPAINERLQRLVSDGFCTQDEMNQKVKSKIRMLSENDGMFAIEELNSVDRTQIRNFGSYFMGILNRYMRGERKDVTSGRKTLAEVRHEFQHTSAPNRYDDRRRDDRYERNRDSEPHYRRSRSDHTDTYRRDRSRDRYGDMGGRPHEQSHDPYNQRNQGPPYPGQPPMGNSVPGNPPPPPPRPPGMPGGVNPYQPQQSAYGQNAPPPYGQPPQSQQYPPPSPYGNPPSQGLQPMGSQQAPPPQYGQQPFVQQAPYGGMQQGNMPGQGPMPNPPPNSYGPPPTQQQPPYMGQQQQSYSNPSYSAPNSYSQPPRQQDGWNGGGGMPQNQPAPAVDILALADKASSAVQALQSQNNKFQGPPGGGPPVQPPPSNPYQPNYAQQPPIPAPQAYPPMNQPYQQQQQFNQGGKGRRRTTATMNELPITVQYAVQNLQATGQINGPLDEGMLGMVKDLPEDLALQALQKFSSIDKNTMRNKTAYLAGVLRRELEKINRR